MDWPSGPEQHTYNCRIAPGAALTFTAVLALSAIVSPDTAFPQGSPAASLAESSTVIVRGKVLRINASDEPILPASNRTAIIFVRQMYLGSEIAGDQRGKNATVILSRPDAVKPGDETIFFGNVRFLGRTMTIADEGEISGQAHDASMDSVLRDAGQVPSYRAILDRLAVASLVFLGTVQNVRALEGGGEPNRRTRAPVEHDPEWQVATVRIITALRGGAPGDTVTIVFAASRDITWFNSPKLKAAREAVFLAHAPSKEEEGMGRATGLGALLDKPPIYLVTEPYDVLPPADEARVRSLLSRAKER